MPSFLISYLESNFHKEKVTDFWTKIKKEIALQKRAKGMC